MNRIEKVKEFMITSGQEVKNKIELPSKEIMELRVELLEEEVRELKAAFKVMDLVEVYDAFQDIQYVLDGAINACGMQSINDAGFQEVHRSNMSKFCESVEEAEETVKSYAEKNIEVDYKKVNDKYVVFRKSDNKTLKSINYSPADLKTLIDYQLKCDKFDNEPAVMSDAEAEKEFAPFKVVK